MFQHAWEIGRPYDLICLDIVMPDIDGLKVLKVLRTMEEKMGVDDSERVRIIMVSAAYGPVSKQLSQRLGSDGYIVKPIDRDLLIDCLKSLRLMT